jgi:hypothetical protein
MLNSLTSSFKDFLTVTVSLAHRLQRGLARLIFEQEELIFVAGRLSVEIHSSLKGRICNRRFSSIV